MTANPRLARLYAEVAHSGQLYNADVPYTYHLDMVVDVLKRFGIDDPVMLCAGYLHDSIEDRGVSYNDIRKRFGEDVAELVYAVTNELGKNRKERAAKTYPKIRGNPRATALKLADRIANVEHGLATGGKQDMYAAEFEEFRKALWFPREIAAVEGGLPAEVVNLHRAVDNMWNTLERLLSRKAS